MTALITAIVVTGMSLITLGWPTLSDAATIRGDTIACTWPVLRQLQELRTDTAAFQRRWQLGVLTGEYLTLNAGDTVMVLERSVWSNASRVKRPGSIRTDLWVPGQYDVE